MVVYKFLYTPCGWLCRGSYTCAMDVCAQAPLLPSVDACVRIPQHAPAGGCAWIPLYPSVDVMRFPLHSCLDDCAQTSLHPSANAAAQVPLHAPVDGFTWVPLHPYVDGSAQIPLLFCIPLWMVGHGFLILVLCCCAAVYGILCTFCFGHGATTLSYQMPLCCRQPGPCITQFFGCSPSLSIRSSSSQADLLIFTPPAASCWVIG